MSRAWKIVLVIVFITILIGATAIGVGYLTGADLDMVYETLKDGPVGLAIGTLLNYWERLYSWALQVLNSFH